MRQLGSSISFKLPRSAVRRFARWIVHEWKPLLCDYPCDIVRYADFLTFSRRITKPSSTPESDSYWSDVNSAFSPARSNTGVVCTWPPTMDFGLPALPTMSTLWPILTETGKFCEMSLSYYVKGFFPPPRDATDGKTAYLQVLVHRNQPSRLYRDCQAIHQIVRVRQYKVPAIQASDEHDHQAGQGGVIQDLRSEPQRW